MGHEPVQRVGDVNSEVLLKSLAYASCYSCLTFLPDGQSSRCHLCTLHRVNICLCVSLSTVKSHFLFPIASDTSVNFITWAVIIHDSYPNLCSFSFLLYHIFLSKYDKISLKTHKKDHLHLRIFSHLIESDNFGP